MKKNIKKYEAFSLVEMLLTIAIIGIIMLLVATTLTTLIKVSMVSNSKNLARNDSNFVMEYMSRMLGNSTSSDIKIYDSSGARTFDLEAMNTINGSNLEDAYVDNQSVGNEIHIKSFGYDQWICIGFFKDSVVSDEGYLVKSIYYEDTLVDHSSCFEPIDESSSKNYALLHSDAVKFTNFNIEYMSVGDNSNLFVIDSTVIPVNWPTGFSVPVVKEITRQTTVSTQGLTWY